MPQILLTIRCEGAVPGGSLDDPALKAILKEAWFQPGRNWQENFRPKHFTKEGGKEYGYEPRRGEESGSSGKAFWTSYTGRKLKKWGHTLPLVWSGDLRSGTRAARIENRPTGVKVVLSGANKANWHNPKSKINMRDELTRISVREAEESADVLEEAILAGLHRFNGVTVRRFGESASHTTSVVAFFHGD